MFDLSPFCLKNTLELGEQPCSMGMLLGESFKKNSVQSPQINFSSFKVTHFLYRINTFETNKVTIIVQSMEQKIPLGSRE